ncbi:MAG: nickel insertion protein, partial [Ignisphaera sp.]
FSHGIVSVPAPATLEILRSKGFPFIGKEVDAELTTPTGAAIIVNLAKKVMTIYPLIRIQKTGYGAGFRDFKEFPNITRIFVGEILERETMLEEILLIETNLDDVTGETLGYLMEKLFNEGAKDVCFIPVYAKKNRPAHIIRVMADEEKVEHLVKLLIKETGSLGVRIEKLHRYVLKREFVNLELPTELGQVIVRIKVEKDSDGKIINFKPEYEYVKLIAEMPSGRIVGAQVVGWDHAVASYIDVVAAAIAGGMTIDDLFFLDMGYTPSTAPVWHPLIVATRVLSRGRF